MFRLTKVGKENGRAGYRSVAAVVADRVFIVAAFRLQIAQNLQEFGFFVIYESVYSVNFGRKEKFMQQI